MRKKCLSTSPAWAFPDPEYADNSATNGWDVEGSAGPKTASMSAGPARVAVDLGGVSGNGGGSINRVESSKKVDSNTKSGSTNPKGALSPQAVNDPPVGLFCLTEIVDKPLEWVVEGVIPRGELTLITGEAGVGKSAFLAGMIANVTRGMPGPRGALCQDDALRVPDPVRHGSGRVSEVDRSENRHQTSAARSAVERGAARPHDTDQRRSPYVLGGAPADSKSLDSNQLEPIRAEPTPAAVVIFSTANMLADSVRPRLVQAGADLRKVYALCQFEDEGQFEDQGQLEAGTRPDGERNRGAVQTGGAGGGRRDHSKGVSVGNVGNISARGTRGAGEIPADADAVAGRSSLRPRMFQWHRDLPVLEAELERLRASGVEVSMMVIDSVDGFVESPKRRSLLAAEVEKLAELARKFKVAIVLAANVSPAAMLRPNRPRGMAGIYAISTVARTVWMVVHDLENTTGRMLLPIKKNYSMNRHGFAFFLDEGKVVWDAEPIGIEGEDFLREAILSPPPSRAREHQYEHDRVTQWLYDRLQNGSVSSFEIQAEAAENEIRDASLRRAFRSLGCKTNNEQEPGGETRWYWRLPGEGFFFDRWGSRFIGQPVPDPGNWHQAEKPKSNKFEAQVA